MLSRALVGHAHVLPSRKNRKILEVPWLNCVLEHAAISFFFYSRILFQINIAADRAMHETLLILILVTEELLTMR